jgi:hypothetical protein
LRAEAFALAFVAFVAFVAEEAERFFGFVDVACSVVSAAGAPVTVAGAVVAVVVLDVAAAGWVGLLAPHPPRVGASRTASATARVTRRVAQWSERGTDRERGIQLFLRGPSANVNRVAGPSHARREPSPGC